MGISDLVEYIKKGENESLKNALQVNPAFAERQTEQGVSLLLFAAYCRNMEAVQIIRSFRTEIDLYEAVVCDDLDLVQRILEAHPDWINLPASDGFSALGLACFFGRESIALVLLQLGAAVNLASANAFKVAPIHSAAAISHLRLAQQLLDYGADVNATQQSGVTPLHSAAHNGSLDLTSLFLNHGADVQARTNDGKTPLDMAKEGGFVEVAALLQTK
ncbi:MAG: ankyrin repeat domain-containing protein [Saprospiraceae bacterium]|nr:ankyrin repeat domain-containing protein [Saprospiraceae bacterium]